MDHFERSIFRHERVDGLCIHKVSALADPSKALKRRGSYRRAAGSASRDSATALKLS
jgi:hypothetical protein